MPYAALFWELSILALFGIESFLISKMLIRGEMAPFCTALKFRNPMRDRYGASGDITPRARIASRANGERG